MQSTEDIKFHQAGAASERPACARLLRVFVPLSVGIALAHGIVDGAISLNRGWMPFLLALAVAGAFAVITVVAILCAARMLGGQIDRAQAEWARSEEALRESEERFRSLIENLNVGVYRNTSGGGGRFLHANRAIAEMFGYASVEEFMASSTSALYQDAADRARFVGKIAREGAVHNEELRLRKKDGSLFWGAVTARASHDEAGQIRWIDGVVQDITERKRAEEELHRSQEHVRALVSASPVAILSQDVGGNTRFWNVAAERTFGWTEAEMLGKPNPTVPAEKQEEYAQLRARVLGGESFSGVEVRRERKDGTPIDLSVSTAPVRDQAGRVVGIVAVLEDISDRKRVQEERRQAQERLRALILASPVAIQLVDAEGRVRLWNPAAERVFGWTEAEALGRFNPMIPPEKLEEHSKLRARVMAGQSLAGVEVQRLRKDGTLIDVSLSTAPVHDESGRVVGAMALHMDITDRKRADAELRNAKEAAEAANRAKSEFLANMSHEIRTPMTAILGYADLLLEPAVSVEERQEFVQIIQRNGTHLLTVLNDILDLSKIEAGKMTVDCLPCSIREIVGDVALLMRGRAQEKNLKLEVEYGQDVPAMIWTDPVRLRQILMNLVGNAVKFTELGGVQVAVSCLAGSQSLRVQVQDTGIGMDAEQVGGLFRPFQQADSSMTRRFGGTGLGLSISQRLAQMLGGDIQASSVPGKGSLFSLTVSMGPAQALPALEAVTAERPIGSAGPLAGRILLAEDGPDNQRLISLHLRRAGAEVQIAENGRVAVEMALAAAAAGRGFDLVLMDMQMPEMDGCEATRQLREQGFDGPIIALTAHAMASDHAKCLEAGCDGFATKPIAREALVEMAGKHLRKRAA